MTIAEEGVELDSLETRATRELRSLTEEQQGLLVFTDGITVLKGRKGAGKTLTAVALAHLLQKNFGIEVVADFPLHAPFGPYEYFDIENFVRTLRLISEEVRKGAAFQEAAIDTMMKRQQGTLLTHKVIILDEVYQYIDCRNSQDPVTKLMGYWISQIRHYQSALFIIAPHTDMIDKRVNRQVDRVGSSYTDSVYETDDPFVHTIIDDLAYDDKYRFHLSVRTFGAMYDTHVLSGFRSSTFQRVEQSDGIEAAG
ncbi:hypothetical protein LCGC14_0585040 [marine sediment metagenome]|uniref:AAA+ ATPase domain-containing protein n=1 Tax=marine sediment metagenome TaxID=412755 RepID=A0A0F9RYX1_9ZZZZ